MEWPKRARTADWENGVLTLDGEKKFEIPELTLALMERLAGYTLVGFHVKGYPVTDELLAPFAEHKSMVNFGVEDGALTDACFPVFFAMPKLRYLLLDGNAAIHGSGLSALQSCKLDLLTLNRTGLDDAGLLQAASIPNDRTGDLRQGACRGDGGPVSGGTGPQHHPGGGRAGGHHPHL